MKNIHTLPTDKPSRLYNCFSNLEIGEFVSTRDGLLVTNQNIYITSDEEIKEGDWCLKVSSIYKGGGIIQKYSFIDAQFEDIIFKKIILTTDQDLIKDGVQAIDDEFLEWFVKNPSCEEVEVKEEEVFVGFIDGNGKKPIYDDEYKIIFPKEEPKQDRTCNNNCSVVCGECQIFEPKQETLEDFIKRESKSANESVGIVKGAKWQQEQDKKMYSEEDIAIAFNEGQAYSVTGKLVNGKEWAKTHKKEWFEQFKKK